MSKTFHIQDGDISDGYHTFDELYEHRVTLYIAFCNLLWSQMEGHSIWRAKQHYDGSVYEGWFVLGIGKEIGNQISYHLPMSKWDETGFAETLEKAPQFDGHTSQDVIERLKKLYVF